ncbi:diaminopimelate epimerase [Achromobacter xylosoxidans]|jgi:diaminopimelate epimerase|uniref:Diaminopimelate epimerase n=2 Tax=Achromobacter TaxID=222 RepID=A0A0D6IVE6_ALCXX|nr:diaminopimelate epimerase [Achromobacter xylosoxidans]MCH4573803.1 diaminopimelate epimerase [Achromobacter xylosoxidans]MCZ8400566.1 diaminopimelate epimerase [Achromobacter xylosoxidans]MDD7988888.1 diaminopimelate epimerase [Achromobacter xylosoxidans]NEV04422.1 diaminopimelate epimerase [Achromobacter xylosoxidans]OFO58307.1 diaminopimelate epimerase [Achromobacter xylosoxidans]
MGDNPPMNWNFTKMHGAGNDFVVLDGVRQAIEMTPERARALGDRHFGIGADQILLVERATRPDADFRYRIFNADGSEVEHCGNGARCFVRFVHEQGLSDRNPLRAEIATGILVLDEGDDEQVTVDMGSTRFDPAVLPFDTTGLASRTEGQDTLWQLELDVPAGLPRSVALSAVAISNPHAVQVVDNVDTAPVAIVGPLIENHPRFARRVNAGFMQIVDRHSIRLRVHERGAGETLACGTGACAAVAAGIRRGLLDSPVRVQTRGGVLTIAWNGEQLRLTGPAESVFTGQVDIDKLVFSMALNR